MPATSRRLFRGQHDLSNGEAVPRCRGHGGCDHRVEGVGRRRLGRWRNFAAEGHKRLVSGLLDERGEAAARGEDAASGQVEGELAAFICDNRQGNEAHQARRPHR